MQARDRPREGAPDSGNSASVTSGGQTSGQPAPTGDGVLRMLVTADNHLSAYLPRLTPQRQEERRRRLRAAFAQTVEHAISRKVHLYIQAGDLFDSVDPRNLEREFVAHQLARLRAADIAVFAVSGNHDTPRQRTEHGGASPQGVYAQLGGLRYFAESDRLQPVALTAAGLRVAVAGLSNNPGAAPGGDPLDGVTLDDSAGALDDAAVRLLILHAAIEGHGFPGEDESFVRRASLARFPQFRLIIAGHIHAYQRFAIGDQTVVVCGPTERMTFGESERAPGCAYLEVTAAGLRAAEHIHIPPQPRHVVTIRTPELWPHTPAPQAMPAHLPIADAADSLAAADTAERDGGGDAPGAADVAPTARSASADPTHTILARIAPFCAPDAMVRLRLEGPLTREQYRALDLRRVWLEGQRTAFSFEADESGITLSVAGSTKQLERGERVAPLETLEQVARDLMAQATTSEERALLTRTRERVLAAYAQLTGREAGQ